MNPLENMTIRPLKKEDLETIIEIDEKILGENRKDYWERKLALMNTKASQVSLVAEVEGKGCRVYSRGYQWLGIWGARYDWVDRYDRH